MTTPADTPKLDPCGCCETDLPQPTHDNRPGQPALSYCLGTHADWLRRMLARLSRQAIPDGLHQGTRPLAALTTRASDDPAIALLDTWATVADVLTFYQERIANEGFLRTATERRSVLELARAIGYELNPGVAASTYLAFTVQDVPGLPDIVTVPQGTKVQSIPAPGKQPQTFETSEDFQARAEWNELRPRLTWPQELALKGEKPYLLGLSTSFPAGTPDLLTIPTTEFGQVYPLDSSIAFDPSRGEILAVEVQQIYLEGTSTNLKAGDLLLMVGKNSAGTLKAVPLPIKRVEAEMELNRTRVDLAENPPSPIFAPFTLMFASVSLDVLPFNQNQVKSMIRGQAWRDRDLNAFMGVQGWKAHDLLKNLAAPPIAKLPPADEGVFAFRTKAGVFGHNAPRWDSLPLNQRYPSENENKPVPYPEPGWDDSNEPDITENSRGVSYRTNFNVDFFCERPLPEATTGSWLLLENAVKLEAYRITDVREASLADFSISAKVSGFSVTKADGTAIDLSDFKLRSTTIRAGSEGLILAQMPIEDPLAQGNTSLMLDGMVLGLQVGQPLVLSGEQNDAPGVIQNEALILTDIIHNDGYTTLYFKEGLKYSYVRKTVTLNANVARATHGQTVHEVLGSGDGAQVNQRFTLKKPPLTYVSAPTPSGAQSTLTVRVNGVQWAEAPSLYGLDARSQNYIVRIDNEGQASVIFGDGEQGTRLPTGLENIVATYRSGIGPDGEVEADSLTLLQTRPLGIRDVTNPVPASGAAAPETLDTARTNAPLTVLTMDRIVSLQDFEDFARSFAGIGKAQAVVLWNGENNLVHITVATASGKPIDSTSDLYTNLVKAIHSVRDPVQQVRVDSFQPLFFNLKAKVLIDPRHTAETVLADADSALQAAFAFEQRAFGQPVTAAEVVSVIQKVPSVVAVDLDKLYLVTDASGPAQTRPASILPAARAHWPRGGQLQLAQLLLINPIGITLEEIKP